MDEIVNKIECFDYSLPETHIAKHPAEPRDHSKLLTASRTHSQLKHSHFYQIGEDLNAGDLLVLNNTKVLSARIFGQSDQREFEILLLQPVSQESVQWSALVRPGKKIKEGKRLHFPEGLQADVIRNETKEFQINFEGVSHQEFSEWLDRNGELPLPPYLKRPNEVKDKESYQTVYAKEKGSVAAPTAGLHFTDTLMESLKNKGVEFTELTLHVGYGTFAPIQVSNIDQHQMHYETYEIPKCAQLKIREVQKNGGRVIPVGTTSLRSLESWPRFGPASSTNLFVRPGFEFKNTNALITNFHLPKTSLLVLVASLLGQQKTLDCYQAAIEKNYRFFSFGDAMFIT